MTSRNLGYEFDEAHREQVRDTRNNMLRLDCLLDTLQQIIESDAERREAAAAATRHLAFLRHEIQHGRTHLTRVQFVAEPRVQAAQRVIDAAGHGRVEPAPTLKL